MESTVEPFLDEAAGEPAVRGFLHLPAKAAHTSLVLTHGAGANCQAPLLAALANAFAHSGLAVLRCDLPFRQKRPHGPPVRGSAEQDQQGLRRAAAVLRNVMGTPVFLGGHSYGGRQASMLAAAEPEVASGLLLLSYPLHPPRAPEQMRTGHFPKMRTGALFVQGTRDGFATTEEMETARKLIPVQTRLLLIEGAGHELMPRKAELKTRLTDTIVRVFAEFFRIPEMQRG